MSLMLDSHSRIAIPYESHFFIDYYKKREAFGSLKVEKNKVALVKKILNESYVLRWDQQIAIKEINLEKCESLE